MAALPLLPQLPQHTGYNVAYIFVLHLTDEPSLYDDSMEPRTLLLFQNGKLQTTNGQPHGHWQPMSENQLQLHWDNSFFSKGRFLQVHNFTRIIYTNTWQRTDENVPSAHVLYLIQVAPELPSEQPMNVAASYRFPSEVPSPGILPPHCTPAAGYTAEFLFVVHTTGDPSFGNDCRRPLLLTLFRNGSLQTNYGPPHGLWLPTSDKCIALHWDAVWCSRGQILKVQNFQCIDFTKVWQRIDDECQLADKQYLIPVTTDVQILSVTVPVDAA